MPNNNQTPFNNQWQWMEAGRIMEDYSPLDGLAELYKRKVLDLISLCKYKVVVFDFDGTLTEFKYDKDTLLPCKDDNINQYFESNNFYENCQVLKTMQFVLDILYPFGADDAYILSVSQPNVCASKLERIKKDFPIFREENIYQVRTADEKLAVLKMLHEKHGRDIVFIEDTAKTLLNAEEKFSFVHGYHISSLIP
jgi:5'(3')-deoxyribonucleotidase